MSEWNAPYFTRKAMTVGPYTVKVIEHVLKSREHEIQTYRLCMGILNFTKKYSKLALEDCCKTAVETNHISYSFIKNSKKKDVKLASNTVDAVVVLKERTNIINEFVKFREYLRQEQISHKVIKIRGNEVHIKIYKVSEGTIYDTLKKLNLNGNMYIDSD